VNTGIVRAERNLPAGVAAATGRVADGFRSRAGSTLADKGLDPADVAEMVLDGIRTDRFWILTHPEWHELMDRRVAALHDGRLPHASGS
jgi:hypothetical protein